MVSAKEEILIKQAVRSQSMSFSIMVEDDFSPAEIKEPEHRNANVETGNVIGRDFVQGKKAKRKLGTLKGKLIYMADDFDETPGCFKEYI